MRLKTEDAERILRLRLSEFAILTWLVVVNTSPETNMVDVREREKIAREIEKSESIRKKHRALKTGTIEAF